MEKVGNSYWVSYFTQGKAIKTRCVLQYTCVFMDRVETGFLES